jgi:hypothetical protein
MNRRGAAVLRRIFPARVLDRPQPARTCRTTPSHVAAHVDHVLVDVLAVAHVVLDQSRQLAQRAA